MGLKKVKRLFIPKYKKKVKFQNFHKIQNDFKAFKDLRLKLCYCYVLVIEEANWLTLYDDISHLMQDGFDAVICLGNSFAHLLDSFGDQREQR